MFRYPGFGYISYSEMPGQFRQAVQTKLVFRVQWLYVYVKIVIHQVLYKRGLLRHVGCWKC